MQTEYGHPLEPNEGYRNRSVGREVRFYQYNPYIFEYSPDHPAANVWGHVLQHRLVAEACLGRYLNKSEKIHHEDRDKHNNSPENLWVFPGHQAHMRHHKKDSPIHSTELAEKLKPMAADESVRQMDAAKVLGVSVSLVQNICDAHGIEWVSARESHLTEDRVREALTGHSTEEASRLLGVTHMTVRSKFPALLTKRVSPGFLEAHKEEIHSLARSSRLSEIGARFGVHGTTVGNAIRRWKKQEPDAWSDVSAFLLNRKGLGRPPRSKVVLP
jgi:DNA-binding CsgD family transcriptional regulator